MADRFWLKTQEGSWREVTKDTYVLAERASGFRNTMGRSQEPATAAFGSPYTDIQGTTFEPKEDYLPLGAKLGAAKDSAS